MIKFNWEVKEYESGRKYIWWNAAWDGSHETDIVETYTDNVHPFFDTGHFKQSQMVYENKIRDYGKAPKDFMCKVLQEDGSLKDEIFYTDDNKSDPEEWNPDNIREVGDVVAFNPVTEAICKMINDKELIEKSCGSIHPYSYRKRLITILDWLWD